MPSSLSTPRPVEPATTLTPVPLLELLATINDHRDPRGIRHRLDVLLAVALAAVAVGAKSYTDIADWANDPVNTDIAELGVDLHRRPSEPTLRRALSGVDADLLDRIIGAWIWTRTATVNGRRVIAVDGKTVRGARTPSDPDSRAPHLVAAFDHCHGAVVGQVGVDAKTNEIPATRELLGLLDLTDVLVSLDALHTQVDTAKHIVAAGGDYLMTVKKNQKSLYTWAKSLAWHKVPTNSDQSRGHGLSAVRQVQALQVTESDTPFPHATQVIKVVRKRTVTCGKKGDRRKRLSQETVYLLCSLGHLEAPIQALDAWIRGHWGIENKLHWVRDVVFGEDASRVRTGVGPRVMATLYSTVISLVRLAGHAKIKRTLSAHGRSPGRAIHLVTTAHQRL